MSWMNFMPNLSWHNELMILSAIAAIAGLGLLFSDRQACKDDLEVTDRVLLMMSFTYWLVYCAAVGAQKLILPEWEMALLGVKFTGVIAYLLTATSVMSLPLHRVSIRQPE